MCVQNLRGCVSLTQHDLMLSSLMAMLQDPLQEADSVIKKRFPIPHFVNCDQNGSQARFLLAKLNPSSTHNNQSGMSAEVIMTDDVSLQVFTDHLKKLAVQS